MRYVGSVEKILVFGILIVIGAILAVAIKGASSIDANALSGSEESGGLGTKPEEPPLKRSEEPPKKGVTPPEVPRPVPGPMGGARSKVLAAWNGTGPGAEVVRKPPDPVGSGKPAARPGEDPSVANRKPGPTEDDKIETIRPVGGSASPGSDPVINTPRPGERPTPVAGNPGQKPADFGSLDQLVYVVQSGETLETIARKLYGKPGRWAEIWEVNLDQIPSPKKMQAGASLKLPAVPTLASAAQLTGLTRKGQGKKKSGVVQSSGGAKKTTSTFARLTNVSEYQIGGNDTLMKIARQHYGTDRAWKLIHEANKDRIPNPDIIPLGKKLRLPEK